MRFKTIRFSIPICFVTALLAFSAGASAGESYRVGDIKIYGIQKIKPYIITRELPFAVGDIFDEDAFRAAKKRIQMIPGVDYLETRVGYQPRDSSYVVTIIVSEKRTFRGHLLVDRGYENIVSFGVKAEESNWRGRSENLHGAVMLRGNTVLEGGWENPWLGSRYRIGLGVHLSYKDYKYTYDDFDGIFSGVPIRWMAAQVYFLHPLGWYQRLYLGGGVESVKSSTRGMVLTGEQDTYPTLAAAFHRDSRSSRAFPWDSSFIRASLEVVGPGMSEFSILETRIDARKYLSIRSRTVVALQALFKMTSGDRLPPYRRHHLGGARTLRAYDYGKFHGTNVLLGGAEYRIPINFSKRDPVEYTLLGLSLILFGEAGATWEKGETLTEELFYGSFGLGISLMTKNALGIRFDYAWHPRSSGRGEVDVGLKF